MIEDEVRRHYVERWGEPTRSGRFDVAGVPVGILKWDERATGEGVALYATLGASATPLPGRDPTHRVEFFLGLLPAQDDAGRALAMLAATGLHDRVAVDAGGSVTFEEPLWASTGMRAFLLLHQLNEIVPPLSLPDRLHVDFLQAVPAYDSELRYKAANGVDALLREWERAGVRFWDPARGPSPAA